MSNSESNIRTSADGTRKLTSVLGDGKDKKPLVFVRPSKLAEEGTIGVVAEGIYAGTQDNPFNLEVDGKTPKKDFRIEGATEDYIINTAGSLSSQLAKIEVGTYVQIQYMGKQKAKKGAAAGKMVHNFMVLKEDTGS